MKIRNKFTREYIDWNDNMVRESMAGHNFRTKTDAERATRRVTGFSSDFEIVDN